MTKVERIRRSAGARAFFWTVLALALFTAGATSSRARQAGVTGPPLLTYDDLVRLYEDENPPEELQSRLTRLLGTPFVRNVSGARGAARPDARGGEQLIRVALWNIERGLEFDAVKAALTGDQRFFRQATAARKSGGANLLTTVLAQAKELRRADLVILNEVDWGLKRTGYRNVARELADAAGMSYAYGVEFVEVDPLTLGTETLEDETDAAKAELVKNLAVDKGRTLGLHGTAILSRFPLRNVRVVRFALQGHDWYADEKKGVSKLEAGKRKGAGVAFGEKIAHEVRRGGRMALLADIEDKRLPGGAVTVVATHLESKTKPENRRKQLEELLALIKNTSHPVILAGDMNTSGADSTPTSAEREVKKRMGSGAFWATQGVKYATGVGLFYDVAQWAVKSKRMKNDPTVKSVRLVSENPEEKFFTTMKEFRFDGGGAFDFRGTKAYSVGGSEGTLANSNERAPKGFVPTFELKGKVNVTLKLDWIFVKPARLTDPEDRRQSYLFAPRFGRTLKALNQSVEGGISDHSPLVVDLKLSEESPRAR